MRILHQWRATYVLDLELGAESYYKAEEALRAIGITEWDRADHEHLHFADKTVDGETVEYLAYGRREGGVQGYRFVNVKRPEGMPSYGWHETSGEDK